MALIALLNEKELLLQVADGHEVAYKQLFTTYWDEVFSTAFLFTKSRELSQDLAQDVFARIWVNKEKLREVNEFKSYLFIVARNVIFDRLRQKVFTAGNETYLKEYFDETSLSPSHSFELKEMEEILHRGIGILPEQQRKAFCLSRFQGLRHEEIAQKMGISKESVKSYIVRAICHLRKYLSEHAELLPVFFGYLASLMLPGFN
ncbi:RNA polymerase sigma factor [Flavitalea flava]